MASSGAARHTLNHIELAYRFDDQDEAEQTAERLNVMVFTASKSGAATAGASSRTNRAVLRPTAVPGPVAVGSPRIWGD
jgi:hypothetical protein